MKRSRTLLNLRSEPKVSNSTLIGKILPGEPIFEEAQSQRPGWLKVKTKINGTIEKEGFVSAKYLRGPFSQDKEKIIASASFEWYRFEFGKGKEHIVPFCDYVGEMWNSININLDGTDMTPWSAAFISYVIRKGGAAYDGFCFAAAHAKYINDSIKKCNSGQDSPFWGYRITDARPEPGDLVCAWRINHIDFDYATVHNQFKSHCDLIYDIEGGVVKAIGGNVSNSVSMKQYRLNNSGYLANERNVFALLKNKR